MEIIKTKQRRPGGIKSEVKQKYAHPLQFYSLPPEETISLQEFEEFAVERLKGWCCHKRQKGVIWLSLSMHGRGQLHSSNVFEIQGFIWDFRLTSLVRQIQHNNIY